MKKNLALLFITFLLASCSIQPATDPVTQPPVKGACGDGICDSRENASNCPEDCGNAPTATPETEPAAQPAASLIPAGTENTYWVINPTSRARLYVRIFRPDTWNGTDPIPALVMMPGGTAESDPQKAARLADQGFLAIIFDADGRGQSEGTEDYNGYITQDGLAAVIVAAAQLPGLDMERYGLVSYSYGVTAATGALARYPDLPIRFYVDWEGPVDRNYTTTGCGAPRAEGIQWQPCSDNAWWAEREAITFITSVRVPYQRIQSEQDHVQMNNNHAIDIINAAVAGGVPWARLNDYPPNQTYDKNNPPAMIPEAQDKMLEKTVAEYATRIIEHVLPGLP